MYDTHNKRKITTIYLSGRPVIVKFHYRGQSLRRKVEITGRYMTAVGRNRTSNIRGPSFAIYLAMDPPRYGQELLPDRDTYLLALLSCGAHAEPSLSRTAWYPSVLHFRVMACKLHYHCSRSRPPLIPLIRTKRSALRCRVCLQDVVAMLVANRRRRLVVAVRCWKVDFLNADQSQQCDGQQPACARCLRLGLKCIGSGQRRFKFIQIQEDDVSRKSSSPEKQQVAKLTRPPPLAPANEATRLASSFVSSLGVKDPRFSLSCYGVFLPDIPKRLGVLPALDASASALVCAYPTVYQREPSYEALEKYGRAMQALREALDSPDQTRVVEILCAIYFLLICQVCLSCF